MPDEGSAPEVTFDLTPEEWVEVAMKHTRESPLNRKQIRDAGRLFVAIVLLLVVLSLLAGEGLLASLLLIPAGLVVAMLMPKIVWWSQKRAYQKFAEDGIANGMFGTHRVRLTEQGMVDETESYTWMTRWHAIERVEDGAGSFMIYTGKNAFLPIPHSAFRDSAQLRVFGERSYSLMAGRDADAEQLQQGDEAS